MEVALSLIAALIATAFTVDLYRGWRERRRFHAEVWTLAFAAYALASWALVVGLANGWTSLTFRLFYFLGAIANIPLLAVGSIALKSTRAGRLAANGTYLWLVFGFFATFFAPFAGAFPEEGIPDGSDLFEFTFMLEALTLPGPRLFAAISGAVGTVVVVGLALLTILRMRTTNPALVRGNALIVVGTLVPAFGGLLTAFGDSGGLAISLAVGISLLWLGYRAASSARSGDDERSNGSETEAALEG